MRRSHTGLRAKPRRPGLVWPLWLGVLAVNVLCGPFTATASAADWRGYPIIEWQPANAAQLAALKRIGVTAAAVIADRDGTGTPLSIQTAPLHHAGLRWYIENIATDFYSSYHRWTPGQPVNWRFLAVQRQYRADPHDLSALIRDPSLSDPVWQARIDARIAAIVRQQRRAHPLFYDLGDETGIADLTAFWDFDFSPDSLNFMRAWLRTQYASLAALNAEWGTQFATWHEVRPDTTIQAMRRSDGNFAAWADFKAWMDKAYADALRRGTAAVHRADPDAIAGIEGAQIAGWGGYDYTRLTHAVDLIEGGDDPRLLLSLNPRLILLQTLFGATPQEIHAIWQGVLGGRRGLILWNEDNAIVRPDGTLTERGRLYAALFATLHRIVPLLAGARLHVDPVAILYSPASFRTQWMLDQQPKGEAWIERDSEQELEDNAFRRALYGYTASLRRLGLQPHFVSAAMLAGLRDKLLVLPDVLALSRADAAAIVAFVHRGGVVIADRQPGVFDAHSRRLRAPALGPGLARMVMPDDLVALRAVLAAAHVAPMVRVDAPQRDVATYVYRNGQEMTVGLLRLGTAETPERVVLSVPGIMQGRDLRSGERLGPGKSFDLKLGGAAPVLLLLRPG